MSLSSIPRALREAVFDRDEGRCQYCQLGQWGHGATFHVNHVIPRSRGGATALENLALQCPHCSLHKADRLEALDPQTAESTALFHPFDKPGATTSFYVPTVSARGILRLAAPQLTR